MKILIIIVICLLLFVVADSIADNNLIDISRWELTDKRLKRDCRIVFLSDLHDNKLGKDNSKLVELIEKEKPDLILVGGDMITAKPGCSYDGAVKLMSRLSQLKIPIIYGMGNHEYRMKIYPEDYGDLYDRFMEELKSLGVNVVCNDNVVLEEFGIDVQGLMLDRVYYKRWKGREVPGREDIQKMVSQKKSNEYRILLAHNPEFFNSYEEEADLILSGHFHGGIARIPGVGGIISPRLTLFPKYSGGRYEAKENEHLTTMLVSRGLGSHTIPVRVFNRIELPVIELKGDNRL